MVKANRSAVQTLGNKEFPIGKHEATIKHVKLDKSTKGDEMLIFRIGGEDGEVVYYNLLRKSEYFDDIMQRILASVEDAGKEIDDEMDYEYNPETAAFFKDADVFIKIREGKEYQGKKRNVLSLFLTQEEFDTDIEDDEEGDDAWEQVGV